MPTKINDATRIIDLTVGQLEALIRSWVRSEEASAKADDDRQDKRHVYGLKGLAKLLGCSKTTAARLKATGNYDEAITQVGALLIIDADKVLEIARNN